MCGDPKAQSTSKCWRNWASNAAVPCLHQDCLLQMQLGPLIREHAQISLGLIKIDLQHDGFASSEICKCFFNSFQFRPCYLGWLQIAALCTVEDELSTMGWIQGLMKPYFCLFTAFCVTCVGQVRTHALVLTPCYKKETQGWRLQEE